MGISGISEVFNGQAQGRTLRRIRTGLGLTLADVGGSENSGLSVSMIGAFEQGNRSLSSDSKQKILDFLKLTEAGFSEISHYMAEGKLPSGAANNKILDAIVLQDKARDALGLAPVSLE